ncbi:DUF2790 domain-containing protein [Rhodococcus sp. IEGM1300]
MKMLILGIAALLVTGSAFADVQPTAPLIHDKTGFFVHMDVDQVLSSTNISDKCGLIPARLDYLDHQGREHVLDYRVDGTGCTNDH